MFQLAVWMPLDDARAQIQSVAAGGTWSDGATWVGGVVPGPNDHAVVRGTVSVGNNASVGAVTVEAGSILQNVVNTDRTLTVSGNVTNNGTIRNSVSNWWLTLRIGGNLVNNGVWSNYRTYVNGAGDQVVSQATGTTFATPMTSEKPSGRLVATSGLDFSSSFYMAGDVLDMGGWPLTFRGDGFVDGGVITTMDVLTQQDATRSAAERTRFLGTTTIQGTVNLGRDNVFEGTLLVEGTLQNVNGCDCTNYVEGNVVNNGTVRNSASNWWNFLRIHGNVTNNGVWSNQRTYLIGTGDQTVIQAAGTTFEGPIESLKQSGTIRAGSDLDFSSHLDLNGDPMAMGAYTLTFRGSGYVDDGVIAMTGDLQQFNALRAATDRTRYIGTATIRQTVNMGRDNVFEGTLVVADTLQNISGCDCTTYVEGDVVNNGTIRNSASNWWNYLRIHGDVTNNGVWTNRRTYLIGVGDQTLTHGAGTTFEGDLESLKTTGFVRAGSDLDVSALMDLNNDSLYTGPYGMTLRNTGRLGEASVFMDAFLQQTGPASASAAAVSDTRFIGTTRIRERVNLGRWVRFAGTVVVEDTLQNQPGCDCTATVEGHLINEGTIRNSLSNWWLYLNLQGSVTNRGVEWSNRANYLNGNGMRTWDAPGVTAPMTMNGGNIVLTGDNRMARFNVTSANGPVVASGARFQVPPGSSGRLLNHGAVYVHEDVSAGGTFGLHLSDFRVAAAAFDSLEVVHHGNQAPYAFSNAVRSYWTIRRVPESATGAIEWMNFGYLDDQLGSNAEAALHVFHSEDDGQTWRQITSEGNVERHPESNYLRVHSVPSSGLFALSSDPDMITVLPSVITSVIGRDQIRLGPPNRYTIHYANNSDVPTGDMIMMLHVNRNIHIDHIEPSAPEGVKADWLYPEDFAIYGDSTVAPPDTVAFLILQSMAPREERSFDVVLTAYPDGYGKGIVFVPAIGAVVWWAATGLTAAYVTDLTFNVVEESFARTDGAQAVINEAFRKTNTKWFSFEKPATELAKDLALTWGQGIIGGTLGTAAVVAVKVGEGLFNWFAAIACGGDRYVNGRQTISACIDKPLEKVTSWDPNEKVGPTGYGPGGHMTSAQRMTYQILFENKAEATAPAWKIVIDDTLSAAFDASTARFEGASHEGFSFTVNGQALHWEITGIELPPNVTPPEGEGYVEFSVEVVPGLPSGTPLENRAVIVFDFNPPIMTNTFVNTLDFQPPVTTMEPLPATVTGGDLVVRWTATDGDGESGVHSTNVFMSVDGGAFQSVGATTPGSGATAMTVPVSPLHEYRFYALSKDHVGNVETVRPALATTSVVSGVATDTGEQPIEFALGKAWPNPFNAMTSIAYSVPESGRTRLVVYDVAGRRVATLVDGDLLPGRYSVRWDAGNVASGVYFYRLTQGSRAESRPVVLLK
jgi:hypothetical protein